jgi:hypothetical protein
MASTARVLGRRVGPPATSLKSGTQLAPPLVNQIELLGDWHRAATGFEEHLID